MLVVVIVGVAGDQVLRVLIGDPVVGQRLHRCA